MAHMLLRLDFHDQRLISSLPANLTVYVSEVTADLALVGFVLQE